LYWLTVELSDEAPLVLAVDDLHWADSATLLFLEYLGRRLDELPVLIACALRPAEPGSAQELLDALRALSVSEVLRPGLLSEKASAALIARAMGHEPAGELARACYEVTGGNPFLLEELVRALTAQSNEAPDVRIAAGVRTLGPKSIARSVSARLARVWPDALELARAVAVLDTDAALRHAASIAGLDQDRALAAADALTAACVLAADRPLRFLHPILRQAVYEDLPPGRRAADHRRVARILDEEAADPDRAAIHLLPTEPSGDQWVVGRLRVAAGRALGRGAPAAAVTFLCRALAEPPLVSDRGMVLLELGRATRMAGDPDASTLLTQASELVSESGPRVEAARELAAAHVAFGRLADGAAVLERTAEAAAGDRETGLMLDAELCAMSVYSDDLAERAWRRIEPQLSHMGGHSPAERLIMVAAAFHWRTYCLTTGEEAADLCERAVAGGFLTEQDAGRSI
jgi:hypothetical protein